MNDIYKLFERIKEIRKKRGLSQEKLAEMVGMNNRTIARIENRYNIPSIETVDKIAKALDVNIADLFENDIPTDKDDIIQAVNLIMAKMDKEDLRKFYRAIYYFYN